MYFIGCEGKVQTSSLHLHTADRVTGHDKHSGIAGSNIVRGIVIILVITEVLPRTATPQGVTSCLKISCLTNAVNHEVPRYAVSSLQYFPLRFTFKYLKQTFSLPR
jgi:hypothetical protein